MGSAVALHPKTPSSHYRLPKAARTNSPVSQRPNPFNSAVQAVQNSLHGKVCCSCLAMLARSMVMPSDRQRCVLRGRRRQSKPNSYCGHQGARTETTSSRKNTQTCLAFAECHPFLCRHSAFHTYTYQQPPGSVSTHIQTQHPKWLQQFTAALMQQFQPWMQPSPQLQ